MTSTNEKQLDAALEEEFKSSPEFCRWFLARTKFSRHEATYRWSRSDHPWGRIPCTVTNPITGCSEEAIKESETDILVVFEASSGERFALHVENKLGTGKFTALQPELYAARAKHWAGNPKYGSYRDFETVLVAPRAFYDRNKEAAAKFDQYISHEEIAAFIPLFGDASRGAQSGSPD